MPLPESFWDEPPEPPRPMPPWPDLTPTPLDDFTSMSMGCKVPYTPNPCGEIPGPSSNDLKLVQTMWDPMPGGWPKGKSVMDQMQAYLDQKLKPQTTFMSQANFDNIKAFDFETNGLDSNLVVMDSLIALDPATSPGQSYLEQKVMEHIRQPTTTAADKRLYALLLGATRAT
jgi:hypothetical protein